MAGTLTISTLSDGTNSTSSTNCIQGSAKAWVNFNGTAATVTQAYNVSSITRNTTGTYTINFTTNLASANYAVVGSSNLIGSAANTSATRSSSASQRTVSSVQVETWLNGFLSDSTMVDVAVFR